MTTYYVDFVGGSDAAAGTSTGTAWKRCKGMTGVTGTAASTTPVGGDTLIFKGGSTWTSGIFPWAPVGGASSQINYISDGSFGTGQAIFDGGGTVGASTGLILSASGVGYMKFNNMRFKDASTPTSGLSSTRYFVFSEGHHIEVSDCTLDCECAQAIYFACNAATTFNDLFLLRNDVSKVSSLAWIGSTVNNAVVHNVKISSNNMHDMTSELANGVHGDGLYHYFSINPSGGGHDDPTQYMELLECANNKVSGDMSQGFMTSFIYHEGAVDGIICGNDFSFDPVRTNTAGAFISIGDGFNTHPAVLYVLNNTLVNASTTVSGAPGFDGNNPGHAGRYIVKNNICYKPNYAVFVEGGVGGNTFDYNMWSSQSGQLVDELGFHTYSAWVALGYDTHTSALLGGDPLFVNMPTDNSLQAGSPAIGQGIDLSGLGFTVWATDRNGNARGSTPDLGAYQYSSAPSPPGGPIYIGTMA